MCSILGVLELKSDPAKLRETALALSKRLRHRGPDWSGIYSSDRAILVHERLAIVDIEHGAQPLFSPDGTQALAVNGEIYNHQNLRRGLNSPVPVPDEFGLRGHPGALRRAGRGVPERP